MDQEEVEKQFPFMKEAREDLSFDMTNIDRLSIKIPMLQEKYARLLMAFKSEMKKHELKFKEVEADKFEYYTTQYPLRIDRRDVDKFLWKDDEFKKQAQRVEACKLKVEYVQSVLNALGQASWNINNAIKMHMFKNGVN